ncbi:hypothetical protein J6590_015229 [Homalodisca vitripennis]|nr:hypothetical protein J6590_015229 [Homalodisca vitripennis]
MQVRIIRMLYRRRSAHVHERDDLQRGEELWEKYHMAPVLVTPPYSSARGVGLSAGPITQGKLSLLSSIHLRYRVPLQDKTVARVNLSDQLVACRRAPRLAAAVSPVITRAE